MSRATNEEEKISAEARRELVVSIESLCEQREFRTLVRQYLSDLGLLENQGTGASPFTSNALTTAYETGRLAAAQYFIAMLTAVKEDFYLTVLKEHLNATRSRSRRLADLNDAGRDYPDAE